MAQNMTWRGISRIANASRQHSVKGVITQMLKKNSSNSFKAIFGDLSSSTLNGQRQLGTTALQKIIRAAGVKNSHKFKMSEIQRCLSSVALITKDASACLIASSGDGDSLEGSEDGEDVCSQGKSHSRSNKETW